MKLTLARFAILALSFVPMARAQLTPTGVEQPVTYSGKVASLGVNAPALNFSSPTGTNTFILASQPETAARIYIVNETPNACNSVFQITVATTAQKNIGSFNNTPQNWVVVPIINSSGSYAANSGLVSIPANGSITVTSAAIAGQNVAVFVVNTTGACASTSIDVLVEFATVAITSPLINVASGNNIVQPGLVANVQGIIAQNNSLAATNPVAIGGRDEFGNSQLYSVATANSSGFSYKSMPIGGMRQQGNGATYSGHVLPQSDTNGGPLAIALFATSGGSSGAWNSMSKSNQGAQNCSALASCAGLYVADSGYESQLTGLPITSSQTVSLWSVPSGGNGVIQTCSVTVAGVNTAGGTPTLDIYFQDSGDNNNWDDRIHFTQMTTGTTRLTAGIAGISSNGIVHPLVTQSIAAGTIISGPLKEFGRFNFVTGGTTPGYNVSFYVNCK